MRRRKQRVLGHSFLIKYLARRNDGDGDEYKEFVETSLLFTKHNTGRKRARYVYGCGLGRVAGGRDEGEGGKDVCIKGGTLRMQCLTHIYLITQLFFKNSRQAAEINKYARGELDWLEIVEAKKWNALGILAMVFGLVFAAFALLLGDLFGRANDDEKDK